MRKKLAYPISYVYELSTNQEQELRVRLSINFITRIKCLSENISLKTKRAFDVKSLFQILVRAASSGDTICDKLQAICPT
ncbi:hypothetical protein [Nostoc sp.]|uniref:hypothetical protein n=1 Tax=Nostoc sp. TaxID=1180 RepID=UPI003006BF58